MLTKDRMI